MRLAVCIRSTAVLFALSAGGCAGRHLPPPHAGTREALLAVETAWDDAVARRDSAALDSILAPDFVSIDGRGRESAKRDVIAGAMDPDLRIEPFQTHDVVVRVYGGTAVLTGWFSLTYTYRGQRGQNTARYTDVYAWDGRRWRAVSGHSSPLAAPPGS